MNLFYGKPPIISIDAAISKYNADEFASSSRSTVPLLSWLKHEQKMVSSVLRTMGMPADCDLHLEYTVAPRRGKGTTSHTDLMVTSGESSLAVEAKWTEPRYKTVGKWLIEGSNPSNRRDVLTGWKDLLPNHPQRTLDVIDFSNAVYQMVHRAASACDAGRDPRLAYLIFKPSPDPKTASIEQINADLRHLWDLLGSPSTLPFYLVEVNMIPTTAFEAIARLKKGTEDTKKKVCSALSAGEPLFKFENYRVTKIGDDQ